MNTVMTSGYNPENTCPHSHIPDTPTFPDRKKFKLVDICCPGWSLSPVLSLSKSLHLGSYIGSQSQVQQYSGDKGDGREEGRTDSPSDCIYLLPVVGTWAGSCQGPSKERQSESQHFLLKGKKKCLLTVSCTHGSRLPIAHSGSHRQRNG